MHFNYTSGFNAQYLKWRAGNKIAVNGNKVSYYYKPKSNNENYSGFKSYLTTLALISWIDSLKTDSY
jgi:hypothetical protein|tara:strand:+ start:427 stop:627 length:201 start_codon:yes stop_codon:yes gene_type:complete